MKEGKKKSFEPNGLRSHELGFYATYTIDLDFELSLSHEFTRHHYCMYTKRSMYTKKIIVDFLMCVFSGYMQKSNITDTADSTPKLKGNTVTSL